MTANAYSFFIFFPPTRQKYACRDPLKVKYTECGLSSVLDSNFLRVLLYTICCQGGVDYS